MDENDGSIEFETAWSMPHPIYAALAKYTPIRVVYADEDIGSNCGLVDFFTDEDGDVSYSEVMEGSEELACDCWGYGTISVYDENGDWIEDCENPKFIEANKRYSAVQEEINNLMTTESLTKDLAEV